MTPLDKLNLFLFLIQVKFVMAGVINSGSLSIVDSNPTATSREVLENVEHVHQAEPDLYDPEDAQQKGPISEGVIISIVVVLLIVIVFLIALSCIWGSRNWDLLSRPFRRAHTGTRNCFPSPQSLRRGPTDDAVHLVHTPTSASLGISESAGPPPVYPYPFHDPPTYPPPSLQIR